jgi:tetratricopeptide (TPR) repeat protein
VAANNFRAMALVKLGRRAEAGQTIDAALARSPEDAFSHANKGWALLEARRPKEALDHFREALRLDPNFEYARLGIIEALKARNPIYGLFLRYALCDGEAAAEGAIRRAHRGVPRQPLPAQSSGRQNPALEPYLMPIFIAYGVFALWTWLARPLFNLLLRLHPLGKHALSQEEKTETNWIGGLLGTVRCFAASASLVGRDVGATLLFVLAMMLAGLTMPTFLFFQASPGWPRRILLGAVAILAAGDGRERSWPNWSSMPRRPGAL